MNHNWCFPWRFYSIWNTKWKISTSWRGLTSGKGHWNVCSNVECLTCAVANIQDKHWAALLPPSTLIQTPPSHIPVSWCCVQLYWMFLTLQLTIYLGERFSCSQAHYGNQSYLIKMFLLVMRDLDNADDVEEDTREESVPLLSLLSLPEDLFTARWLISFRYSLYTLFLLYNR